jgi:hypothetical protein
MTQRSKNLLEAFKASSQEEKPGLLPRRALPAPKADDPFAVDTGAKAVRSSPADERGPSLPQRAAAASLNSYLPALLLALVALVGLAFWLGRMSGGDGGVAARERDQPLDPAGISSPGAPAGAQQAPAGAGSAPSSPAAPAANGEEGWTPAERALWDPANKYTVIVVEYTKGRDEAIAEQTHQYLAGQGLAVAQIYSGARLFLVAGAAPQSKNLDALCLKIKELKGPPPLHRAGEFHDAYIRSIDAILQRPKS